MQQSLEGLLDLLAKELHTDKADKAKRRNIQQRIQYVYGNLALLCRYTGKFFQAIRYAEIALNIVENLPRNQKEILRALNTLGHVLAVAGRNVDAHVCLEQAKKIYRVIPDRLLGGRVYSNFCQLSYGSMEFAHLLEYYRAEELHEAVEQSRGTHIQEYIDYAGKAIQLLKMKPVFYKELADARFSLGELYMMMPTKRIPDKWKLAEQAFDKALRSACKSQFTYRVLDTLESLVILYYFRNSAEENLSLDQKKKNIQRRKKYQKEIAQHHELQTYPDLAGRYELILGDIDFDEALEKFKVDNFASGIKQLERAFDHYIDSANYKKKFNQDEYYLMLPVIYNRLESLVRLTHPLAFPPLASIDNDRHEDRKRGRLLSPDTLDRLRKIKSKWEHQLKDFTWIFDYALLLGKKSIKQDKRAELENELTKNKEQGRYWKVVLVNKWLI
ncbi:MAG: tetratricopeptide repeat protein, partial [Candidatus Electrothrix sp. ATG2]|nr:tetratricopeptide repeat protein [Candidatus Electrothrix sp. ATG2]